MLNNLSFCYQGQRQYSLTDCSLEVSPGEFVVIAGRSGSGKTTLLHCLTGLIPTYYRGELHGSILIEEMDWTQIPLWKKAKTVGAVFQDPRHQFFSARVEQELTISPVHRNRCLEKQSAIIEEVISLLELENLRCRLLDTLSSGEQQRVAIGTALILQPSILVLDEPSANLSPEGVNTLAQVLSSAKKAGKTIIVAEHRFHWLRHLVDRLIVLDQGRISYNGKPDVLDHRKFCHKYSLRFHKDTQQLQDDAMSFYRGRKGYIPSLALDYVGFRYGKNKPWLFKNLAVEFYAGEAIALIGRNGCGKTTLLELIFGLYKPTEGRVAFTRQRYKKALTLQHPDLQLFASTVREEISRYPGESSKWLKRFDLLHVQNRHPLTLSGGEMQRLLLAASLARVQAPGSFLLLDEPTSGMDGYHLAGLLREIKSILKHDCTVIIATHDLDLICGTCNNIIKLGQ